MGSSKQERGGDESDDLGKGDSAKDAADGKKTLKGPGKSWTAAADKLSKIKR